MKKIISTEDVRNHETIKYYLKAGLLTLELSYIADDWFYWRDS